jgi:hypothetical protein
MGIWLFYCCGSQQTSSGSALQVWSAAMGYVPADAVCLYDENSVSAGSKCGGSAYGSTDIPAASEPEKAWGSRIVDIFQPPSATRNNGIVSVLSGR